MKKIALSIFLLAGAASLQAQTNNNTTPPGTTTPSPSTPKENPNTITPNDQTTPSDGIDNSNKNKNNVDPNLGGKTPSNKKDPMETTPTPMDPSKNQPKVK